MRKCTRQLRKQQAGGVLVLAMILLLILSIMGLSMLTAAVGVQQQSIRVKREAAAAAAAEAAYEQAVFWMCRQPDLFLAIDQAEPTGTVTFPDSAGWYSIRFAAFADYRPVFEVLAHGQSGLFEKNIRVFLVQAITGWEMGSCRVPSGYTATTEVFFADREIIDMPIHINSFQSPDDENIDIHVQGNPDFRQPVSMSESRHSASGKDKYSALIDTFDNGIYFNQPQSRISDEETIRIKLDWFRKILEEQKPDLILNPAASPHISGGLPTVHLEFFVGTDGIGYLRITNHCTVRGYQRNISQTDTWDYKITPGTDGKRFEKYPIYGYHYIPENASATGQQTTRTVQSTYVTPTYGTIQGTPGGELFVDGHVVIGSSSEEAASVPGRVMNLVQGRITVVATGNIWLTNSIQVSDRDDAGGSYPRLADGRPAHENPNSLGLVARGVVKIIDPGLVEKLGQPPYVPNTVYQPVGILDLGRPAHSHHRHLPDPLIVEAAVTVCGGGWGAENVLRGSYGGRKEQSGKTDDLLFRGLLVEAIRGVVGVIGTDGYVKQYYLDERLTRGIVPGNLWFKGKYIPVPGGWIESRNLTTE